MFDVSFAELMVVAVVALLVIGPEKLPKVARTVGAFAGRMQRYVAQVKEEINREVRFEELQKLQEEIKQSVEQHSSAVQIGFDETLKRSDLEKLAPQSKKTIKSPIKKTTKNSSVVLKSKKGIDKSDLLKTAVKTNRVTTKTRKVLAENNQALTENN